MNGNGQTVDLHTTSEETSTALPKDAAAISKQDLRPTYDQLYLMDKINDAAEKPSLTIAAVQRLNTRYGVAVATSAMRMLRGFPPEAPLLSGYAYVEKLCRENAP
jgi:hypothetical protein